MSGTSALADMATAVQRMRDNQNAVMYSLKAILDILQVQGEKLDAIMEAATREAGPSPIVKALENIGANMHQTTRTLEELPQRLAAVIADEIAMEIDAATFEPASSADFEATEQPH